MRLVLALLALCALPWSGTVLRAGTITNVNLSSYVNGNWGGEINGSSIKAAPTSGNTGTGLTFSDYNGSWVAIGADISGDPTSVTINLAPLDITLTNNVEVNSLMSLLFGRVGLVDATTEFTDSNGDNTTYNLKGTDTIRDYNNNLSNDFSNALSGSDPGVTAQMWWDNCPLPTACNSSTNYQRLDAQTFMLPGSWSGFTLQSMIITDPVNSAGTNDVVLSALQVDVGSPISGVPEPSSFLLLAGGLAALTARSWTGNHRRRQHNLQKS